MDSLCSTISSLVGLFYRIHCFLNYESKILFYNSHILLIIVLQYGGMPLKIALKRLRFRLQKRTAHIVLNVPVETSSLYVFSQLNWMSIYQQNFVSKILMYQIVNTLCFSYLQDFSSEPCDNFITLDLFLIF